MTRPKVGKSQAAIGPSPIKSEMKLKNRPSLVPVARCDKKHEKWMIFNYPTDRNGVYFLAHLVGFPSPHHRVPPRNPRSPAPPRAGLLFAQPGALLSKRESPERCQPEASPAAYTSSGMELRDHCFGRDSSLANLHVSRCGNSHTSEFSAALARAFPNAVAQRRCSEAADLARSFACRHAICPVGSSIPIPDASSSQWRNRSVDEALPTLSEAMLDPRAGSPSSVIRMRWRFHDAYQRDIHDGSRRQPDPDRCRGQRRANDQRQAGRHGRKLRRSRPSGRWRRRWRR
jgi:hypothetical protein